MNAIRVLDHGEVELITHAGGDESVLRSMLVSTGKDTSANFETTNPIGSDDDEHVRRNKGRINFLMRDHHGTPFEHNIFTFRVKAPIFVLREWHRHRIGWSYNEQSGRYMELGSQWYVPALKDVRKRVGKAGSYTYEQMSSNTALMFLNELDRVCGHSYERYKVAMVNDIAPEQARLFLHVNHYVSMYATCNARSLMNFLVLRNDPAAQWEIREYALRLENIFAQQMPVTYEAFLRNGRIAP
jgi:thymidylate synthase (FAD)